MIRKLTIALAATVALGAAALAPTAASAFPHHYHHGWHHGWHVGFYGPDYGPDCYIVRRVVQMPWGPRARRVTVCD
jgi:hydrogenase/urease accessory protein HupE